MSAERFPGADKPIGKEAARDQSTMMIRFFLSLFEGPRVGVRK
jgi:hypothetical protein